VQVLLLRAAVASEARLPRSARWSCNKMEDLLFVVVVCTLHISFSFIYTMSYSEKLRDKLKDCA
jgi:hypothetical protein